MLPETTTVTLLGIFRRNMHPKVIRQLNQYSMRRSPRWRYERIREILSSKAKVKKCCRYDDLLIKRAFQFVNKWDSFAKRQKGFSNVQSARQQLFAVDPAMYLAYEIFSLDDAEKIRYAIEARILARESDKAIADRMGTLDESIGIYEQLFFNVRDRLNNSDYIVNRVIAPVIGKGYETANVDFSSKFFGYFAGSQVLDVILTGFDRGVSLPADSGTCDEFFDAHFSGGIRRRAAESVTVFEVNKYNVMQLFDIHAQLISVDKQAKEHNEELNSFEKGVDLLLKAIPFATGSAAKGASGGSSLSSYGNSELRADELMRISRGETITLDGSCLKIPDKREGSDE